MKEKQYIIATLCIEKENLDEINTDVVVDDFSSRSARRNNKICMCFFHLPCGFSSKSINLCLYLLNCFGHTIYSKFLSVYKGPILSSRPRAPNMYEPALPTVLVIFKEG